MWSGSVKPNFSCTIFRSGQFFWILCKKIWPLSNLLFIADRKFLSKLGQHISWNGILQMGKVHHVGRPIIRYIHVKYWFRVGFFRSYHHSCTVALPFKTFAWFIDASCWPRQPFFGSNDIYICMPCRMIDNFSPFPYAFCPQNCKSNYFLILIYTDIYIWMALCLSTPDLSRAKGTHSHGAEKNQ